MAEGYNALALVWTQMPPGDEKWAVESADEDSEVKSQPIKLPKREGKVCGQ
jgi:hypothetical protein